MEYNKRQFKKNNDKKILHKMGKSWKTISIALLLAIGGTAVATNANADSTNLNTGNTDPNEANIKSNQMNANHSTLTGPKSVSTSYNVSRSTNNSNTANSNMARSTNSLNININNNISNKATSIANNAVSVGTVHYSNFNTYHNVYNQTQYYNNDHVFSNTADSLTSVLNRISGPAASDNTSDADIVINNVKKMHTDSGDLNQASNAALNLMNQYSTSSSSMTVSYASNMNNVLSNVDSSVNNDIYDIDYAHDYNTMYSVYAYIVNGSKVANNYVKEYAASAASNGFNAEKAQFSMCMNKLGELATASAMDSYASQVDNTYRQSAMIAISSATNLAYDTSYANSVNAHHNSVSSSANNYPTPPAKPASSSSSEYGANTISTIKFLGMAYGPSVPEQRPENSRKVILRTRSTDKIKLTMEEDGMHVSVNGQPRAFVNINDLVPKSLPDGEIVGQSETLKPGYHGTIEILCIVD